MKYEMIFCDDDFSGQGSELAEVKLWHDCFGHKFVSLEELHCMNAGHAIPHGTVVLSMRRIIKEPKHWTWGDKKAGRLPEVGAIAIGKRTKLEYEVVIVTEKQVVIKGKDDGMCSMYGHDVFIAFFEPTETPAEKAKREEDEFVSEHDESLLGVVCMDSSHRNCYELGKRAAYRKLKGGE